MWVVNYRKIFYGISIILVLISAGALAVWGLIPGIDFTGGTLIEVSYPQGRPEQVQVVTNLANFDENASVRPSDEDSYIIRMREVDQVEKEAVLDLLSMNGSLNIVENNFSSIGPVLGSEALRKSILSVVLVIVGILLYITFAFRKVSEPVSSWKYALIAIVGLVHNIVITMGAFAILGNYAGYEVDTLFVTALLVILGFSVHDTIVVFDRVRENLRSSSHLAFAETVGKSISQTFTRSINTSLTTLMSLVMLYIFGGQSTEHFALALIIGIAAGTYSSIFIGSPLLVTVYTWLKK